MCIISTRTKTHYNSKNCTKYILVHLLVKFYIVQTCILHNHGQYLAVQFKLASSTHCAPIFLLPIYLLCFIDLNFELREDESFKMAFFSIFFTFNNSKKDLEISSDHLNACLT